MSPCFKRTQKAFKGGIWLGILSYMHFSFVMKEFLAYVIIQGAPQNPIHGASVPGCANLSQILPREATETPSLNEDVPTSCVQVSDLQVQHKPTNGRSYGFLSSGASVADCIGVPTSLDTEASAQARDSAMMRYKEKKKTRKYVVS